MFPIWNWGGGGVKCGDFAALSERCARQRSFVTSVQYISRKIVFLVSTQFFSCVLKHIASNKLPARRKSQLLFNFNFFFQCRGLTPSHVPNLKKKKEWKGVRVIIGFYPLKKRNLLTKKTTHYNPIGVMVRKKK